RAMGEAGKARGKRNILRYDRPAMTTPRRSANRVRIIGGRWRSRLVKFPPTMSLRPTPDRVRETLFNWLGQRLDGLKCVDLFAGSGALACEALPRAAARGVMDERDREALSALRTNARGLAAEGLDIVQGEALAFLASDRERYDVVFLDPPFASDLARRAL